MGASENINNKVYDIIGDKDGNGEDLPLGGAVKAILMELSNMTPGQIEDLAEDIQKDLLPRASGHSVLLAMEAGKVYAGEAFDGVMGDHIESHNDVSRQFMGAYMTTKIVERVYSVGFCHGLTLGLKPKDALDEG